MRNVLRFQVPVAVFLLCALPSIPVLGERWVDENQWYNHFQLGVVGGSEHLGAADVGSYISPQVGWSPIVYLFPNARNQKRTTLHALAAVSLVGNDTPGNTSAGVFLNAESFIWLGYMIKRFHPEIGGGLSAWLASGPNSTPVSPLASAQLSFLFKPLLYRKKRVLLIFSEVSPEALSLYYAHRFGNLRVDEVSLGFRFGF